MKTVKYSLFLLLLISTATLLAQPKNIQELNKLRFHNLKYSKLKKLRHQKLDDLIKPNYQFNSKSPKNYLITLGSATVVDSVIVTNWNNSIKKHTYSFNANGKMTVCLREYWNGTNWGISYKNTYTYDSNGNMTVDLFANWDGTNWVNNSKETFTYDSNGNVNVVLWEIWDGTNWVYPIRGTYTYDSNGNMTVDLFANWDGTNWVINSKDTYTYDANGNMTVDLFEGWYDTNWVIYYKDTYTYDSNGNMTVDLFANWYDTNWVNFSKDIYTYDSNSNISLEVYETWDGANWVIYSKGTYTYDSNGNMTLWLHETWDGTNWVNPTYDAWVHFVDEMDNYYSLTGTKVEVFYKTITDVEEENNIMGFSLSQNYPNPFNPTTTIRYSIPKMAMVKLSVYDMLGREVATLVNENKSKGNYKIVFDASSLPSGVYFYRLQSGNLAINKKLVLLR